MWLRFWLCMLWRARARARSSKAIVGDITSDVILWWKAHPQKARWIPEVSGGGKDLLSFSGAECFGDPRIRWASSQHWNHHSGCRSKINTSGENKGWAESEGFIPHALGWHYPDKIQTGRPDRQYVGISKGVFAWTRWTTSLEGWLLAYNCEPRLATNQMDFNQNGQHWQHWQHLMFYLWRHWNILENTFCESSRLSFVQVQAMRFFKRKIDTWSHLRLQQCKLLGIRVAQVVIGVACATVFTRQSIQLSCSGWLTSSRRWRRSAIFINLLLLQTSIPPKDSRGKQCLGANNDLAAVPFQFEVDSAKGIPKMASKTVDLMVSVRTVPS